MGATMSTLQAILKNFYIGPVRTQLNNATVLLANLKKSSKEVVGEQTVLPLHVGRNHGVGARGTNGTGTLPTARNQQFTKAYFTTKDVYGRVQISGKTIRATKTDKGAFQRATETELKGMVSDLSSNINRQLYGTGDGLLTLCNGGATSATVAVDSTQYLEAGMYIDIGGDTDCLINSVDSETQITLNAAITYVDNDTIRIAGTGATDELNGLALITDSAGTLQNVNPSTYTIWKGVESGADASPVPLTEDDMQQVQDSIEENGGKVGMIVTSYAGRRQFINLLTSQKRFTTPQSGKLKGGFSYVDFNDIPLTVDRHCQRSATATRMYFLSMDNIGIYRMADFEWMQEDGAVMARQVGASATEAYEATLVCDMELATDARRFQGRLEGIQVS
jgi:hypothetical protein